MGGGVDVVGTGFKELMDYRDRLAEYGEFFFRLLFGEFMQGAVALKVFDQDSIGFDCSPAIELEIPVTFGNG